jgi:hypothetical protein
MNEPQIPVEPESATRMHTPRHGDGAPAAGMVHGNPSAMSVGLGGVELQLPVRTLQN